MGANFVHPPFAHKLSDSGRCRGTLYADLSAWKEYVDYPLELTKGNGAVRAWLNLDQSRVRDFTAELQLPLAHAIDTKANGALQFMHNDVLLQKKEIPSITNVSGKLEFNEKGFKLNAIKGILLGGSGAGQRGYSVRSPAAVIWRR